MGDVTQLKSLEEKEREFFCREMEPFLENLLERCKANLLNELTILVEDSEGEISTICAGNSTNSFKTLYHIQTDLVCDYVERNIDLGEEYYEEE